MINSTFSNLSAPEMTVIGETYICSQKLEKYQTVGTSHPYDPVPLEAKLFANLKRH